MNTDTDRLDWLEKNGWRISLSCWHTGEGKRDNEWTIHTDIENDICAGRGETLRAAIDQALTKDSSI